MGVKEKFNSDMTGVIIVQSIWVLLFLFIREDSVTRTLIFFCIAVILYCVIMHYIFTTSSVEGKFVKYLKAYLFSLQIINTIILLFYDVDTTKLVVTLMSSILICIYTRKNIVQMIDLTKYSDSKSIQYFVILIGMLMATYTPLLMVCTAYILANMLLTYVHAKFV